MPEIRHRLETPFPEARYSEFTIPDDSYLGTGDFELVVTHAALELAAFAVYEVNNPRFELALEAQPRDGVVVVRLGHRKYGDYELASRHIYALPSVDKLVEHSIRVRFEKWQVTGLTVDGSAAVQTDRSPTAGEWGLSTEKSSTLGPPVTDGLLPRSSPLPEQVGTLIFGFPNPDFPPEYQRNVLNKLRNDPSEFTVLTTRQQNTVLEVVRDSTGALVYRHWNPTFGKRTITIPIRDALRDTLRALLFAITWGPDKSVLYVTVINNDGSSEKRQGAAFSRDRLLLVENTLREFEAILASQGREEDAHQFLKGNPILLGLTSSIEPISKLKLGDDYITDFVVREAAEGYVFIEIERPSLTLFKKGDPSERTAELNHAIEQVESWRAWLGRHHTYLASKLEGVASDMLCWIVAGRRSSMGPEQLMRLEEINRTYRSVFRIFTYDDVVDRVRSILARVRATGGPDANSPSPDA